MRLLVVGLLLAATLAGCTESPGPIEETGPWEQNSAPWTTLLCKSGPVAAADIRGAVDECNHRVTLPMLDTEEFNWTAQHGPGNEVSVAADPANPLRVAVGAKDYTVSYISDVAECGEYTVWTGTFWSNDGGITWGNDLLPGFKGDPRQSPLHGQKCNTDPVLSFDADGTLWLQGLNYNGGRDDGGTGIPKPVGEADNDAITGSQVFYAKSTDGGATYEEITFGAMGDGDAVFHDKNWMAVQQKGDHMIGMWAAFVGDPTGTVPNVPANPTGEDVDVYNAFVYSESFDAGATWGPVTPISPGQKLPVNGQFAMPVYLSGEDAVAAIWLDYADQGLDGDERTVMYVEATVTPSGTVFGTPLEAFPVNHIRSSPGRDGAGPTQYRLSTYPVLAVDHSGGEFDNRRYIIWADQPANQVDTDVDVFVRFSDDGLNWGDAIRVNDDATSDQLMPWIDVDPEGGVHAIWYDKRNDPPREFVAETENGTEVTMLGNRYMDVYYSYSGDGGVTWSKNIRVTEVPFDGDLGHHQNGSPFIGDYIGLDTTAHSAHIVWADTRHTGSDGRPAGSDVYSATILKDQLAYAMLTGEDTN